MVKNSPKRRWTRENWKASENSSPFFRSFPHIVAPTSFTPPSHHHCIINQLWAWSMISRYATGFDSGWNETNQHIPSKNKMLRLFYSTQLHSLPPEVEVDVELRRWEWIFIPEANLNWIDEPNQESIRREEVFNTDIFSLSFFRCPLFSWLSHLPGFTIRN